MLINLVFHLQQQNHHRQQQGQDQDQDQDDDNGNDNDNNNNDNNNINNNNDDNDNKNNKKKTGFKHGRSDYPRKERFIFLIEVGIQELSFSPQWDIALKVNISTL